MYKLRKKISYRYIRVLAAIIFASTIMSSGMAVNGAQPITTTTSDTAVGTESEASTKLSIGITKEGKHKSLDEQLDELYTLVADSTKLEWKYVYMLHQLANRQLVYSSDEPDIFREETLKDFDAPMNIKGAKTEFKRAPFVSGNEISDFDSEYYLPDALYSVASDVKKIMKSKHTENKKSVSNNYYALMESVQSDIDFYEAVLEYTGEDEEVIKNFYTAYESILSMKEIDENICEYDSKGRLKIKAKYRDILSANGINHKNSIKAITTLLSYDENVATNSTIERLEELYTIPYTIGETTRENMMIAAMSLVGKVRYIWGGGHNGASYIKGINPVWKQFNRLYPSEATTVSDDGTTKVNEGFRTCIKPSGSWCPVHGYQSASFHGREIYSLDDYITSRSGLFDNIDLTDSKYREMLSTVDYTGGVNEHIIDGLDCSGFTSWLFNQITDKYKFNTAAKYFASQPGLKQISSGEKLLPGDIFAWDTHIVTIVGKVRDNSGAYVTIEETPNVLRFGVGYYSSASSTDIARAKEIASQANELLGGVNRVNEPPHVYCINTIGNKKVDFSSVSKDKVDDESDTASESTDTADAELSTTEASEDTSSSSKEDTDGDSDDTTSEEVEKPWWSNYRLFKYDGVTYADTLSIARLDSLYDDEGKVVGEYNKCMQDMTAEEIISHTLTKLPVSYIDGYETYSGDLFDKSSIGTNIKVNEENSLENE